MTDQERELAIQAAYDKAVGMQDTEKPTYQGTYDQQIADTLNKITNRDAFSYDLQGDPLYNQMKDRYINQGKLAMKDTMGTAAGLTGGYGSSYSQSVGQQQYDAYLQNLTDQIPELANMAYQKYQDEGTNLQNQLSMYQNLDTNAYNRYRDQVTDWNYDQEKKYNLWTDAYNRVLNEENTAYNREQDAFANQQTLYSNLYQLIGSTGYNPSDEELSAAGMSRGQAQALIAAYEAAKAASASSGGGGGGGTVTTNNYTGNAAALEEELIAAQKKGATTGDLSAYATAYANEAGGISGSEARGLAMQVARETGSLNTSKYSNKKNTTTTTTTNNNTGTTATTSNNNSSGGVLNWIKNLFK